MNRNMVRALVILCCGGLFAGGCASNDAVKKEEPLAATPVTQAKQADITAQKQTASAELPKTAQIAPPVVQPAQAPANAGQLRTALEKIYFDFDAATLSEQARATLKSNSEMIRNNPGMNVRIEGNCDERGSAEYNLALGERRAKAAEHYMVTLGVPAKRLSVLSYGKEKPADPGHDDAAWAKNRRDEFVVTK